MGVALVTGATAGLGRQFAEQLAGRGHDLVVVARDRARLEATASQLRDAHGIRVEVLVADLGDRGQLQRVADRLADPGRPVDLLVNNAGFGSRTGLIGGDVAAEEEALDVMVRAVLVLSQAAGGAMRERRRGAILNVSSVAGWTAMGHYAAIKSYVTVLSEALATELSRHGVHVTALCPGFTRTEFHQRAEMDMSRLPEALWLDASDVVRQGLEAVAAGTVVSVPSVTYKAVVAVLRLAPRRVTRRVTGSLAARRRARSS